MLASMGVDAGSIVGVVIGLGLAAVFMWWWTRNTFASNPSSVLRRLHKSGTVHLSHLRSFEGVWDPSTPLGPDNHLFGPAEATYRLDDTNTIHLEFQRRGEKLWRLSGPIPVSLAPPTPEAVRTLRRVHWEIAGFAILMVAGFGVGYFTSSGTSSQRLVAGGVGQLVALSLALVTLIVLVVLPTASRSRKRRRRIP